jgi:hypothetical protein
MSYFTLGAMKKVSLTIEAKVRSTFLPQESETVLAVFAEMKEPPQDQPMDFHKAWSKALKIGNISDKDMLRIWQKITYRSGAEKIFPFVLSLSKDGRKNSTPQWKAIHASTSSARTACRAILLFREVIFNGILNADGSVKLEKFTFHCLRHGFCSALSDSGKENNQIAKLVGHIKHTNHDALYPSRS